jgi:allose kinase
MDRVIGIDIGGTNLRIGIVDRSGTIRNFEKISSRGLCESEGLENFITLIKTYIHRTGTDGKISAIAVGVPSVVSKDKSFIYSTPNLKGIENMDLGHILTRRLGIQVYIDRDVNYLLLNDIKQHNLDPDGTKNIIGMYIGTGLGNAVYLNGSIYVGKNGAAGELGHVPLYGITDRCTCGKYGCVETRMSGKYLEKLTAENFPDVNIKKVFAEKGTTPIIREFVQNLALPISTEINILDPDYVVLAGGVLGMEKFPLECLVDAIHQHLRSPYPEQNIEFVFPETNQQNGVLGGALSVFDYRASELVGEENRRLK